MRRIEWRLDWRALLLLLQALSQPLPALAAPHCGPGQVELLLGGQADRQCDGDGRTTTTTATAVSSRITPGQQRQRDEDRLSILHGELGSEQALLQRLLQTRPLDGDALARSRANLQALQREIARLPALRP